MIEKEVGFFEIPKEVKCFFNNVFELYEIRERIGEFKQIKFYVYGNDHNPPHVHAIYDKYSVSISLIDYSVIAGNLPKKNQNIAVRWVKDNLDYISEHWNNKSLTSMLPLTKSILDSKDTIKI